MKINNVLTYGSMAHVTLVLMIWSYLSSSKDYCIIGFNCTIKTFVTNKWTNYFFIILITFFLFLKGGKNLITMNNYIIMDNIKYGVIDNRSWTHGKNMFEVCWEAIWFDFNITKNISLFLLFLSWSPHHAHKLSNYNILFQIY